MDHFLILDIETVPLEKSYASLDLFTKELWSEKISKTMPENLTVDEFYLQRASILAEFGKIICISVGVFFNDKSGRRCFKLKSLAGDEEKNILIEFTELVNRFSNNYPQFHFAGHNIKEFDIPYICRRMLINKLPLPDFLQLSGMKPWETNLTDTLHLWRFGDFKHYTSLKLLAHVLGIPTPKDDMDGSKVREVYYEQNGLQRIVEYCQKDVITTARILLRLKGHSDLPDDQIFVAEKQ